MKTWSFSLWEAGSDCSKLLFETTEDDEATVGLAAAKEAGMDAKVAYSEQNAIFALKEEQKATLRTFLGWKDVLIYSRLWAVAIWLSWE